MLLFDTISRWFKYLIGFLAGIRPGKQRDKLFSIVITEAAPSLEALQSSVLHVVRANGKDRWAMLRCPCGCGEVLTLSLQDVHQPHWRLTQSNFGHPSLYPSVWRQTGCFSHFWIKDGQVQWC